ncbi:MAG: hypothetical protein AMK73_04875, partial [Planctomycetes bacterium SM23_32]
MREAHNAPTQPAGQGHCTEEAALEATETVLAFRRLPGVQAEPRPGAAVALWAGIGAGTAIAGAFVNLRLGVPGHSILIVLLPFVFGLAWAPRGRGGAVMGGSAFGTAGLLRFMAPRCDIGLGALTSLLLTPVLLDAALARARNGRGIYAMCAAAGLASNMLAFAMRLTAKLLTSPPVLVAAWWPRAICTYPLCGAAAGLAAAAVFFRLRRERGARHGVDRRTVVAGVSLLVALAFAAGMWRAAAGGGGGRRGEGHAAEVGRRLAALAAARLEPGSRVVVVSGELAGTQSALRGAEVRALTQGLAEAGIKVAKVVRPRAGTADLDEQSCGAGAPLLIAAAATAPRA